MENLRLKQFRAFFRKRLPVFLWAILLLWWLPWQFTDIGTVTATPTSMALGLLAKAGILLALTGFSYRLPVPLPAQNSRFAAILAYSAILLGLTGIALHLQRAVAQQHLPLDFDHFFQLQPAGALALIAFLVFAIALFLYAYRLLWEVIRMGIPQRTRLWNMLAVLAVFSGITLLLPDPPGSLQLLLSGVAFTALFDLYIERQTSSLTWLLFWAMAFSIWLALSLFQLNLREDRQSRLVFARELATHPFKPDTLPSKYDYVVFRPDGKVLAMQGSPAGDLAMRARAFRIEQWQEFFSAARADLVFRAHNETVVVIGRETGGYQKPMTLFSGLFAILSVLLLLLAVFNRLTGLIRADFELPLCGQPSLRNRIQLSTIASILGSFLAVGLLSAAYFRHSSSLELQAEVQVFLSALLNLYVFLLLVAGAVAIFVANSITRPLVEIGQKLTAIKLGKNEQIAWQSGDELGGLIGAYNGMVDKLEESTERLKQSEREGAWREMARQVAHEIKNPLTPMKLSVQHLLRVHAAQPDQAAALLDRVGKTLIEQIDVLSGIASEFSHFAKMPEPQSERLDLNDLITSVGELFLAQENATLDVEIHLPEASVFVYADRTHLARILTNLIKNAIQSIPDSREGQVGVNLEMTAGQALICVADNGAGIPAEVHERVFSPYFTTKSSGTGLGLALCKNMTEAMGGQIWFETKEGEGTCFFVQLGVVM